MEKPCDGLILVAIVVLAFSCGGDQPAVESPDGTTSAPPSSARPPRASNPARSSRPRETLSAAASERVYFVFTLVFALAKPYYEKHGADDDASSFVVVFEEEAVRLSQQFALMHAFQECGCVDITLGQQAIEDGQRYEWKSDVSPTKAAALLTSLKERDELPTREEIAWLLQPAEDSAEDDVGTSETALMLDSGRAEVYELWKFFSDLAPLPTGSAEELQGASLLLGRLVTSAHPGKRSQMVEQGVLDPAKHVQRWARRSAGFEAR